MNNDEFEEARKQLREEHLEETSNAYNCSYCGARVDFIFIMDCIKNSGMCPDCWHESDRD